MKSTIISKIIVLAITISVIILLSITILITDKIMYKEEIITTINLGEIELENLDMNYDIYEYRKDGYRTVIGADVSEFNKELSFVDLKEQGIEFIFLRLGWRGYLNPQIHLDKQFENYYSQAKEAGMKIGVYFFSQAINEEEAIEEANFVLENIKNKDIDFYIAYDYESIDGDVSRIDELSVSQTTNNAKAFYNTILDAGYNPIIYTNYKWIRDHYENDITENYLIWYAQYSKNPQYKGKHIIWQYSSGSRIKGTTTKDGIDLNIMITKKETN